jgi:hypothetical protein
MRLKPEKIEDLAAKVLQGLKENPDVLLRGKEADIQREVKSVITMDLRREDEIEEEAREILQQYMKRIYRDDISFTELLRKAKKQIGREKGLIF